MACVHSGHEPSALRSKFRHLNATVCFGDVDLDRNSVVSDVEQCNLLRVVSIVPTLVSYLLAQFLLELPERLCFDDKTFISLKHRALAFYVNAEVCFLPKIQQVRLVGLLWQIRSDSRRFAR